MLKLTATFIFMLLTNIAQAGEWIEGGVTHVCDIDTIEVNSLPDRLREAAHAW